MPPKLDMVGMVVQDMARTLAFYRQLGLEIPAGADSEPHVESTLPTRSKRSARSTRSGPRRQAVRASTWRSSSIRRPRSMPRMHR